MRTGIEEMLKENVQVVANKKESASDKKGAYRQVKTRFGEITINLDKAICFPHGLLGIPGTVHFCLSDFLLKDMSQFKLLQCVEDDNLCFIVIPSEFKNAILEQKDVEEAIETLAIDKDNLVLLFILTVHNEDGKMRFSINARAPIFVDTETTQATQFVLSNSEYQVRHYIS